MEVSCQSKINHFLVNSITPHHRHCNAKTRFSCPSSIQPFQRLVSPKGLHARCFSFKQSVRCNFKKYDFSTNIPINAKTHASESRRFFSPTQKFIKVHPDSRLYYRDKMERYIIVRSELAGSGSSTAAYPLSDFQLIPKIRGICFYTVTAVVALFLFVLMVSAHPFVLLFDRYCRKTHHFIAKVWASLTILPFFKVEFEGLQNLPPPDMPAVFVSNHQSFLDIYTLLTLGRNFKFISKTAIFLFPIVGWAMFLMGLIPLKRMDSRSQLECLKRCMDLIKKGASVFFFPEGTRSRDGKLGGFKKGAFSVAAKTGVPVVPITLIGTGKIMPAGMEGTVRSGSIKVVIHQPIQGKDPDALCLEARKKIADALIRQA